MTNIAHTLAVARPELVVTTLLQHALGATRHALAGVHPELGADDDLGEVDEESHLALLIVIHLGDLDKLLSQYRAVVESELRDYGNDDLPF